MNGILALIFGLIILLGVEIRIRMAFQQISEWRYGMDRLSEEIKKLRSEIMIGLRESTAGSHKYKI